jgi:uncharacterized NAD-dependent epimerase/dehydratase family protein
MAWRRQLRLAPPISSTASAQYLKAESGIVKSASTASSLPNAPLSLHGSQPDVIVVCRQPGRTMVLGHPGYALPSIEETIDLNLRLGNRTNPAIRCAGVSLNTSQLTDAEAPRLFATESARLGLPVADPMRGGEEFERLLDNCLREPG